MLHAECARAGSAAIQKERRGDPTQSIPPDTYRGHPHSTVLHLLASDGEAIQCQLAPPHMLFHQGTPMRTDAATVNSSVVPLVGPFLMVYLRMCSTAGVRLVTLMSVSTRMKPRGSDS